MSKGAPIYQLRLPPEQRERWEAAAKREGLSLAQWIKTACEQAAMSVTMNVKITNTTMKGVEVVNPSVSAKQNPKLTIVPVPLDRREAKPDPKVKPRPGKKPERRK